MLGRMPKAALADFQKGDAVMIVSTEGTVSGGATVITLLGVGVGTESLAAAPTGSRGPVDDARALEYRRRRCRRGKSVKINL